MTTTKNASNREVMKLAIIEARKCRSTDKQDPLVGAVVVDKQEEIMGTAYRGELKEGEHAEYTLLERKLHTQTLAGATVYTTLEPCTKRGEGKLPCAERLIDRKVARVVIGMLDPNREISGDGVRKLQAAGIKIEYFDDDLWAEVEEINRDFRRYFETVDVQTKTRKTEKEDDARVAMRAYIQRAEVRLSTMHRIAGAFLSGAGILILLPILFRDSLSIIVTSLAKFAVQQELWLIILYYIVPSIFVFGIPLWSLWLLLKDLTLFYFTANIPSGTQSQTPAGRRPGSSNVVFHPRFALTGIPFSDDESPKTKKDLRELQFNTPLMNFLLPHHDKEKKWLLDLIGSKDGEKLALPKDAWLDGCYDDDDSSALRMAFGLAGAYNRDFVAEVAKAELSLIRHNIHLRRLLMRYMKALLIIIWTATLSFVLASSIEVIQERWQLPFVLSGLWLWSCLSPYIVRSPVRWLKREYDQNRYDKTRDTHLLFFEQVVAVICIALSIWAAGVLIYILRTNWSWLFLTGSLVFGSVAIQRSFRLITK